MKPVGGLAVQNYESWLSWGGLSQIAVANTQGIVNSFSAYARTLPHLALGHLNHDVAHMSRVDV
jgi:hypothetical protein